MASAHLNWETMSHLTGGYLDGVTIISHFSESIQLSRLLHRPIHP